MLQAERNNYLAAIFPVGKSYGLAFVDFTTSDFRTSELNGESALLTELERLRPAGDHLPADNSALAGSLGGRDAQRPRLVRRTESQAAPEVSGTESSGRMALDFRRIGAGSSTATTTGFLPGNSPVHLCGITSIGRSTVRPEDHPCRHRRGRRRVALSGAHLRRDVAHPHAIEPLSVGDYLVLDAASFATWKISNPSIATRPHRVRFTRPSTARRRLWGHGVSATGCPNPSPLSNPSAAGRTQCSFGSIIRRNCCRSGDIWPGAGPGAEPSAAQRWPGNGRDLLALRLALEQTPTLKVILRKAGEAPGLAAENSASSGHQPNDGKSDEANGRPPNF